MLSSAEETAEAVPCELSAGNTPVSACWSRRFILRPSPIRTPCTCFGDGPNSLANSVSGVNIAAVREHSITSRQARVHVIVCHDLYARSHSLYEMVGFTDRVSPEVLEALNPGLAEDIIQDADVLIRELEGIFACPSGGFYSPRPPRRFASRPFGDDPSRSRTLQQARSQTHNGAARGEWQPA